MKNKTNPKISVIIRTYNEEKMIEKCLNAIFNQKIKYDFEVIIVDSESKDKTLQIISKFPVKLIKIKKKDFTYGKALNIGCDIAKGEFFIFLSAHAIPKNKYWMENLIKNFNNPKIVAAYGNQTPFKDQDLLAKRKALANSENKSKIQTKPDFFTNANSAIKKSVWLKIKFNEKLIASEDHEWAKRIQEQGHLIIYEPKAIIYHSHDENFKQIFSRSYGEIKANIFIYNKKIILKYLKESSQNFSEDTKYVVKNKQNPVWIIRSFLNNLVIIMATLFAFLKSL